MKVDGNCAPGGQSMVAELFGYSISNSELSTNIDKSLQLLQEGSYGSYMACANPHSLVVASRDKRFQLALKNADILLPDGSGIILAAKVLSKPIVRKVAGFDFFYGFSKRAQEKEGVKYFFLGSSEQVLSKIITRMKSEFPSIVVCGTYSPPFEKNFSEEDNTLMIDAINAAKSDVLWVGMTAPKQEKWIYTNRTRLKVPFIAAIGAVFDFYAGTKQRPSDFWVNLGLEWLPRFFREPKRLWERNMKSTPVFLWWVLREKIRSLVKESGRR